MEQCSRPSRRRSDPGLALTEAELLRLARAFAHGRGRDPTFEELARLDEWATRTRVHALLLPLALRGLVAVDVDEHGAVVFHPRGRDAPSSTEL